MNKKEISEIKKQFSPERANINKVTKILISSEKQVLCSETISPVKLSEDEFLEILKLCKASFRGESGKHIHNIEFPTEEELKPDSTHSLLLELKDSKLGNEDAVEELVAKISEDYMNEDSYFITMVSFTYDIPGSDKEGFDDTDVYDGILIMISDAKRPDIGLCYDSKAIGLFGKALLKSSKPMHTFLFPTFDDRTSNVHALLYCAGNPKKLINDVLMKTFGCEEIYTADRQKQIFEDAMTEATDMSLNFDTAAQINRDLYVKAEEDKSSLNDTEMTAEEMGKFIEESELDPETSERFKDAYKTLMEDKKVPINTLVGKNVKIEVSDMTVSVSPELLDLITTKIVDGKRSLVIEIRGDIVMNGLNVS